MSTIIVIADGITFGTHRDNINVNFAALNSDKLEEGQVLIRGNQSFFNPLGDYDPATKLYADNINTSITGTYDPQNIEGDCFLRSNHTGLQDPTTIDQNTSYRFVTDQEKATWEAKEGEITPKYSAFNKDFGLGADQVAYGNHSHTAAEIGLGSVDNTADADKEVSGPQQAALDLKADIVLVDSEIALKADITYVDSGLALKADIENNPYINFDAQVTPPTNEGDLFYANDVKALSLVTDIPGFLHNLGQEQVIRVVNQSGATIPNATPVRQTGASGGMPTIAPAIADTIENSLVQGITTHEIANGEQGFMTYSGKLGGDFSAFLTNDRLFLSETVPGGYTTTAPDIVTFLGSVMDNTVDGNILTKIRTLTSIPPTIAYMAGATAPATLTGGQVYPISGYNPAQSGNVILSYDVTAGTITTPVTGIFRATINIVLSHDTDTSERIQNLEIYNVTDAAIALSVPQSIGRETGSTNISLSVTFNAIVGKTYQLRLAPTDTFNTVTTNLLSFSMESIHIYVG